MAQVISNKIDVRIGSGLERGAKPSLPAWLRGIWVRHRDERQLQQLSDYQLRDLGIRREQIHGVVVNGRPHC